MAQPYVGEIRMFAGSFAPAGWAFCDGQLLAISENETLFQLIGTTYGGDGQSTFGLPDLRGRVPVHQGTSSATGTTYALAEQGGVEQVTLTVQQIPTHSHTPLALGANGNQASPSNGTWAGSQAKQFSSGAPNTLVGGTSATAGGSQPHDNMMPFLTISFILSLIGIFPSQT